MSEAKPGYTHEVDGDEIAVFEWCNDEIQAVRGLVDQLNDSTLVNPNTLTEVETGEDWFKYKLSDAEPERHNTRHSISYANVPKEFHSAMSGAVQQQCNHIGMAIKQVDFEEKEFVLGDQSLFEARFPDDNDWIDD